MGKNGLGRFAPDGAEGWKSQGRSEEAIAARRAQEVELRELIAEDHNEKRSLKEKIIGQNKADEVDVAHAEAEIINNNFDEEMLHKQHRQIISEALNKYDKGPYIPYLTETQIKEIVQNCSESVGGLENSQKIMREILSSSDVTIRESGLGDGESLYFPSSESGEFN